MSNAMLVDNNGAIHSVRFVRLRTLATTPAGTGSPLTAQLRIE